jgi:threonine aldolase
LDGPTPGQREARERSSPARESLVPGIWVGVKSFRMQQHQQEKGVRGMNDRPIDLRSDAVTHPTEEMLDAMRRVEVGAPPDHEAPNAAWATVGLDSIVTELEALGAKRFGKEAAMFLPSTTSANLIACMHYCKPGDQVIVDEDAHVYREELSGMTRLVGATPRVVPRKGALPDREAVNRALSHRHSGETPISLLWVENTHTAGGGAIADPATLASLRTATRQRGIAIHVDGARIFNAAVALGVSVTDLASDVDSLSICFYKGLACPLGALLIGSRALITAALPLRRLLGARLLKGGVVAAACIVALYSMIERLADDHVAARRLAAAIEATPGLHLEKPVVTNIVHFDTSRIGTARQFANALAAEGVWISTIGDTLICAVTHYQVTPAQLDRAIEALRTATRKLATRQERAAAG